MKKFINVTLYDEEIEHIVIDSLQDDIVNLLTSEDKNSYYQIYNFLAVLEFYSTKEIMCEFVTRVISNLPYSKEFFIEYFGEDYL